MDKVKFLYVKILKKLLCYKDIRPQVLSHIRKINCVRHQTLIPKFY